MATAKYSIDEKILPVNPYTRPGAKLKKVMGIVIHWTANKGKGASDTAHYRYYSGGAIAAKSYASAHYFCDGDSILRVIPDNEMAYHVGALSYRTNRLGSYPNNMTIGVETCVNVDGDFKKALDRSAWLVAKLLKDNKLGIDDLYRHYDITGKDCPRYFVYDATAKEYGLGDSAAKAWTAFKAQVAAYMGEGTKLSTKPPIAKPAGSTYKDKEVAPTLVKVIYKGRDGVAVRKTADFSAPAHSYVHYGDAFTIVKKVKSKQGEYMWRLKSGLFITAHEKYVKTIGGK